MRSTRRRQRRTQALHDIPLTPLIDTALTLLVIFMVTSPLINNAIKISLPKGNIQECANMQQEFVVYVDNKNDIFFNGKCVKGDELVTALQQAVADKKDQVVFVKGDEASVYGNVLKLVGHIKKIDGIGHVALVTQEERL